MKAQNFISSWSALWLWLNYLDAYLSGSQIEAVYTFRKARLDIHFKKQDSAFRLSWEKRGNQAILTFSENFTLPKKRVNLLPEISGASKVIGIQLHPRDRVLSLSLESDHDLRFGFFPNALNVYLFQEQRLSDSFLKKPLPPALSDAWLGRTDPLPETIPGQTLSPQQLLAAVKGITLDSETHELVIGGPDPDRNLNIAELTIAVLKLSQKPRNSPPASIQKTARTVLKRWKSKLGKIERELAETEDIPQLDQRLIALKMCQGQDSTKTEFQLAAELSPTGEAFHLQLKPGTTLFDEIEAIAKKIRKLKAKTEQLGPVLAKIKMELADLEQLLAEDSADDLQTFLIRHGESLSQSGARQTERKPYKKYSSPSGFDILVGRASSDNDVLTFKIANKNDWWFHARRISGSHVILRTGNQEPQQADIKKAAEYAALNSKAKHSGIVVVQYCQRKHISKPRGSAPGAVLVHHEKSVTVDLDQLQS